MPKESDGGSHPFDGEPVEEGDPQAAPSDSDDPSMDFDGPSDADLAEMFGGGSMPDREDDFLPDEDGAMPDLEIVKSKIPAKTQVLMEELFRAKLVKVQKVNPKKVR